MPVKPTEANSDKTRAGEGNEAVKEGPAFVIFVFFCKTKSRQTRLFIRELRQISRSSGADSLSAFSFNSRAGPPFAVTLRPSFAVGCYGGWRGRAARVPTADASLWISRAESAQEIDDKAYQQNQAKTSAADDGTAKVKPAAAKQEKQNHHE
jgi:hypothetical protein